jgi:hypothetical protein
MKEVIVGWYSSTQYESYAFIGINGVPLQFVWGSYILNRVVLPQLMWFSRIRKSLASSVVTVAFGLVSSLIMSLWAINESTIDISLIDYLSKMGLFLGVVAVIYLIKSKMKK